MKFGKVTENVYDRSVRRPVRTIDKDTILSADPGGNCAVFASKAPTPGESGSEVLISIPMTFTGAQSAQSRFLIYHVIDELVAAGAKPIGVGGTFLFPADTKEAELKKEVEILTRSCKETGLEIYGIRAEVSSAVNCVVLTLSGYGTRDPKNSSRVKPKPGYDLLVTGWCAIEGTMLLAEREAEKLSERFPVRMLDQIRNWEGFLDIRSEAAVAGLSDCCIYPLLEGGIFGGLWEMAEQAGVGLDVDLRRIPLRQETIEICNYLDVNPYELLSGGSLLIAAKSGESVKQSLKEKGIGSVLIGKLSDSNDRLIHNGEDTRYLEPRKPDQIYG